MLVIHSDVVCRHDPDSEWRFGRLAEHDDPSGRYGVLREALEGARHELVEPTDHGLEPIHAVHDERYVAFLGTAWSRRGEMPGVGHELTTGRFAGRRMATLPASLAGQLGYFLTDTSTPVQAGTWGAAYASAQVAIEAADQSLARGAAYALCRPAGHHAFRDAAGGSCYLNNAAIAAERFRRAIGERVAVLDLDALHGNGTQAIFWEQPDVLTVSVHADPDAAFPFYAGYSDEIGEGAGRGFNRNVVLPAGSGDREWLAGVEEAIGAIDRFRPAAIVVALGVNAAAGDRCRLFEVSADAFGWAAEMIAGCRVPTVMVQEGGSLGDQLPASLLAFLGAYEAAARPAVSA